jgi:hypothetical protein
MKVVSVVACWPAFERGQGSHYRGLELRLMTLSTKYQEFVRQQVKQPVPLDFDPDVILWHLHEWRWAVGNFRNTNHIFYSSLA